jgi:hypothetical protein
MHPPRGSKRLLHDQQRQLPEESRRVLTTQEFRPQEFPPQEGKARCASREQPSEIGSPTGSCWSQSLLPAPAVIAQTPERVHVDSSGHEAIGAGSCHGTRGFPIRMGAAPLRRRELPVLTGACVGGDVEVGDLAR